ncbi:hypothetical protein Ahy_A08g039180 isoform C [Arachis hypogaea]|uniref:Uncharacterized protein n=1 Tax=Arachis hypogaea TaxID=3818 RepID=A0A445BVI0_ARAHY|nr:hypothetical protein Ahy_A08g039180 isoform C [Arachis hypogaea]
MNAHLMSLSTLSTLTLHHTPHSYSYITLLSLNLTLDFGVRFCSFTSNCFTVVLDLNLSSQLF